MKRFKSALTHGLAAVPLPGTAATLDDLVGIEAPSVVEMLNDAPFPLWIANRDGKSVFFNREWLLFTGLSLQQQIESGWLGSVHEDDRHLCSSALMQAASSQVAAQVEYRLRRRDGGYGWVVSHIAAKYSDSNEVLSFFATSMDITERKFQQQALMRAMDQLELSNHELRSRAKELRLLNRLTRALQSAETREEAFETFARLGIKLFPSRAVTLFLHSDGTAISIGAEWKPAEPLQPNTDAIIVPVITSGQRIGTLQILGAGPHERSNEQELAAAIAESLALVLNNLQLRTDLENQSVCDPLTGAFNRRYLGETLAREIARCKRAAQPLCVLMLDLDGFKTVNDVHGHEAGDLVLRRLAEQLKLATRASDAVCRYGGDEFALLMPEASVHMAVLLAERVRACLQDTTLSYMGEKLPPIAVSFGIAAFPDHSEDPAALLRMADTALIRAKSSGRNRVEVFVAPPRSYAS